VILVRVLPARVRPMILPQVYGKICWPLSLFPEIKHRGIRMAGILVDLCRRAGGNRVKTRYLK
jgi:hypothetical protein